MRKKVAEDICLIISKTMHYVLDDVEASLAREAVYHPNHGHERGKCSDGEQQPRYLSSYLTTDIACLNIIHHTCFTF